MKLFILALAFLGVIDADVSHLNNMYLHPDLSDLAQKKHVSYAQHTQDIPQAPVQELTDNCVLEDIAEVNEQAQITSGKLIVKSSKFGPFGTHHIQTASTIPQQMLEHSQQAVAADVETGTTADPGSEIYQSINQQTQTQTHTKISQQPQYYTSSDYHKGQAFFGAVGQQYVELFTPQQKAQYGQQQEVHHHGQEHQRVETQQHHAKPQQHSAVHVDHHVTAVSTPTNEYFTQYQQRPYYGKQSAGALSTSSPFGIDTQYASNGGYVY